MADLVRAIRSGLVSLGAVSAIGAVGAVARADDAKAQALEISNLLAGLAADGTAPEHTKPVSFGFQLDGALVVEPEAFPEPEGATGRMEPKKPVIAYSADKQVAWIATDIDAYGYCGMDTCWKDPPYATLHGTMLVELTTPVHPVAFHLATPVTGAVQAKAVAGGATLPALEPAVGDGAAEAVALFQATLADPKAMAASVSARKDVVLYGSSKGERFVGGAAVKAQLKKWGLGLALIDGLRAGAVDDGKVVWIAANLSARGVKRPKDKPMPYRVLFLYEHAAAGWQLVQANSSYVPPAAG
jgi:hypothetical protein